MSLISLSTHSPWVVFGLGLTGGLTGSVLISFLWNRRKPSSSLSLSASSLSSSSSSSASDVDLSQLVSSINELNESIKSLSANFESFKLSRRNSNNSLNGSGGHNSSKGDGGYTTPLGDMYWDASAGDHDTDSHNDEEFFEAYQDIMRSRTISNASLNKMATALQSSTSTTTTTTTTTTNSLTVASNNNSGSGSSSSSGEATSSEFSSIAYIDESTTTTSSSAVAAADAAAAAAASSTENNNIADFTKQIDEMRERKEFSPVFNSLKATYESQQNSGIVDPEIMWRYARAYYDLSTTKLAGSDEKKQIVQAGFDLVKEGLEKFDNSSMMHKWYAILITALADFGGSKDKIQNAFIFRDHVRRAIELNPKDGSSYHLLARWCFEVAKLSWWEKKAAAALFGAPPESTVEEALELFLKAEEVTPKFWRANPLFIGRCYLIKGDRATARSYFEQAISPGFRVSMDDDESIAEANKELML